MNVAFNYGFWELWQLYHKVTFDGANRIIRVNEGVTQLNIKTDIYSDWKEWAQAMPDNAVWLPAIRTIGGDPTLEGQTAGDIYFLQNGWKLYIDLTKVRVSGILFSDDYDSPYYDYNGNIQYPAEVSSLVSGFERVRVPAIEDIWAYNSRTLTQQIASDAPTVEEISQAVWSYITRSLTEGAGTSPQEIWEYNNRTLTTDAAPSVAEIWSAPSRTLTENPGPTAAEIADSVWDETYADHDLDGTMGHLLNYSKQLQKSIWVNTEATVNGDGSQENPYDNITNAIDRAEEDNIRTIYLIGNITLTRNFKNFYLIGIGVPEVDLNGQDVRNSHFTEVALKGSFVNGSNIVIRDSLLLNGAYLDGFIENSALGGNLICNPNSAVFMKDCASAIPGTSRPTISMNPAATSQLSVRGYNGGLTIFDCNQTTDRVTVELAAGSLTFASSCTNGIMVARGVGKFVDETNGAAVFNETINQEMLDTLEALTTSIQTTTNTIDTNTQNLQTSIDNIDFDTTALEEDIALVQASVDAINLNTDTVESGIASIQSTVNALSTSNSTISTQVNDIDLIVRNINNVTTPLEPKIDLIYQDLTQTIIDLEVVDAILDGVDLTVENTNSIVSTLNTGITSIEGKVDLANANLGTINLNTDTVESSLSSIASTVNTINTNVSDIENLSNTINTAVTDIEALSNVINTNVNDIEALSNIINDTLNNGTFGDGAVTTILDRIDLTTGAIETKVDFANATLTVINTNTDSLETSVATISGTVNTINTSLNNVATLSTNINTNVTDIESLANIINSNVLAIDISGLDTKVDNINATVLATDTKVDSIAADITTIDSNTELLDGKLNAVTTTVNSLNNTVADIDSVVDLVFTNTDTLETNVAALNTKVDAVATNVTNIVGYTNNLQVTIDAVGTDIEANQALINTIQSSLNLVAADVSSIDSKATTINSTTLSTNTEVLSKLLEVWRVLGLDAANPQIITDVSISVGDITLSISQPDASTTEVSRQ